jgi:hypothetical protein
VPAGIRTVEPVTETVPAGPVPASTVPASTVPASTVPAETVPVQKVRTEDTPRAGDTQAIG